MNITPEEIYRIMMNLDQESVDMIKDELNIKNIFIFDTRTNEELKKY